MRKNYAWVVIMMAASFLSSCSNVESVKSAITAEQYDDHAAAVELRSSIADYNSQRFATDAQTRGWFKFWRALVTVCADLIGGAGGGIVSGVAASGAVGIFTSGMEDPHGSMAIGISTRGMVEGGEAQDTTRLSMVNPGELVFTQIVPGEQQPAEVDSIGFYHNQALYALFSDKEWMESLKEKSEAELMDDVMRQLTQTAYYAKYYGEETVTEEITRMS